MIIWLFIMRWFSTTPYFVRQASHHRAQVSRWRTRWEGALPRKKINIGQDKWILDTLTNGPLPWWSGPVQARQSNGPSIRKHWMVQWAGPGRNFKKSHWGPQPSPITSWSLLLSPKQDHRSFLPNGPTQPKNLGPRKQERTKYAGRRSG